MNGATLTVAPDSKQLSRYTEVVAEFGLFLPQIDLEFRQLVDAVNAAESVGFQHAWFMDHFQVPGFGSVLDGWTVASAMAALTSTIRIGHLVLCADLRPPALLGKMVVTLDRISGGRVNLGLGWGSDPAELRACVGTCDSGPIRRAKLVETVEIVRQVLVGGPVDYRGTYYSIEDMFFSPPAVQEHVPIFLGGAGPATMKLVREAADWWNCPSYARDSLAALAPLSKPARISANYSIAFEDRPGAPLRHLGSRGAPVLSGCPAALAEVLAADQDLGVELFNIQLVHLDSLTAQLERFMEQVAPSLG